VATLALVLAANATLFATINATLFRPVPFRSGEGTVTIYTLPPGVKEVSGFNPLHALDLVRYRERSRALRDVSAFSQDDRLLTGGGEPEVVRSLAANASIFRLLTDQPVIGRGFTEDEEEHGARVVVLGYGLWQRRFGGESSVLGKSIEIDGAAHTIVGVMPSTFPPPVLASGLVVPLGITRSVPAANNENRTYLVTVARVDEGATFAQAEAETRDLMSQIVRESPRTHTGWTAGLRTYREWQFGEFNAPLGALFAAMMLLLLIASANLASLTLAHVASRRGEITLRRAIGASGSAIARMIVMEVGILNLLGAAAGVLIATRMLPALLAIDPAATRALGAVEIDWRVAGYCFLSAAIAAAIASAAPAMNASDGALSMHGFGGNTRTHGSRSAERWRSILLVAQTALCLVLLVSGSLLVRALTRSGTISPGFDASHVLTAQLRLPPERYSTSQARVQVMDRILTRLRGMPGVVNASQTQNRFVPGLSYVTLIRIDGQPTPDGSSHTVQFRRVSPEYFRTMRIRGLRGRTFSTMDGPDSLAVAVVSRRFAERFWPGQDPLGRMILRPGKPLTVVGVVDDVSDVNLLQAPEPTLYLTWAQSNAAVSPVGVVVRTSGDPAKFAAAVREAVRAADPALPVDRVLPLTAFLDDSLAPQRFRTSLLIVLAGVGLLLAAIGVAGVTARSISERMGEYGVRVALGCDQARLWRSAVGRQLKLVGVGVALGLALSTGAGKLLAYLLQEIGSVDVSSMAVGAAVLLSASIASAAIPAARVLHLDPAQVLKG
jgi:predicted permease